MEPPSPEQPIAKEIPSLQFIQDLEEAQGKIDAGIDDLYPLQGLETEDRHFRQVLEQRAKIFRKQEDGLKDADGVERGNKRVTIISTQTISNSLGDHCAFIDYETGHPRRATAGLIKKSVASPRPVDTTDIDTFRYYIDHPIVGEGSIVRLIDEFPYIQDAFETAFKDSKDKAEGQLKEEPVKIETRERSKRERQNRLDGDSIQRALASARHIFEVPPVEPPQPPSKL